jgi:hypothetical protein
MFNDIANKRFKAAGLSIFPEWNMAVPFLMAPVADAAHWHESMSMQHLGPLLIPSWRPGAGLTPRPQALPVPAAPLWLYVFGVFSCRNISSKNRL